MTTINTLTSAIPPVIPDFGWYRSSTSQRFGIFSYPIGGDTYPPGLTNIDTGGVTTPNNSTTTFTIPTTITSLAVLQSQFVATGTIVLDTGTGLVHATVQYTGLGTLSGTATSGVQGFTGCTTPTTSTSFVTGSPIYDPRDVLDRGLMGVSITFDTQDSLNLGLPTTNIPSGVSVLAYEWDFDNGLIGRGPQATTTYVYTTAPSIVVKLTTIDSLGRRFSCAHRVSITLLTLAHTAQLSFTGVTRRITPLMPSAGAGFTGTLAAGHRMHTTSTAGVTYTGKVAKQIGARLFTELYPKTTVYPSKTLYPDDGGLGFTGNLTTVKSGP